MRPITKKEHLKGFKYGYWYMICIEYISNGHKYYFSTIENAAKFTRLTNTQLLHGALVDGLYEPFANDGIKLSLVQWDTIKEETINPEENPELDKTEFRKLVREIIEQNK